MCVGVYVLAGIVGIVILWYIQLVIHEVGHLLFAWSLEGHTPIKLRLYPVRWGDFARAEWFTNGKSPTVADRIVSRVTGHRSYLVWDGGKRISPAVVAVFQLVILWALTVAFFIGNSTAVVVACVLSVFPVGDILLFVYTVKWGTACSDGKLWLKSGNRWPKVAKVVSEE